MTANEKLLAIFGEEVSARYIEAMEADDWLPEDDEENLPADLQPELENLMEVSE